jgi:hypothetical protein
MRHHLRRLRLLETERVYLAPYQRGGKTKRQVAETLDALDFLVERVVGGSDHLFHIELKAGPRSIEQMNEFQLDVNDSNDIVGVANKTGLPVYIFHVELRHIYAGPTRATTAAGMWWTDIFFPGLEWCWLPESQGVTPPLRLADLRPGPC